MTHLEKAELEEFLDGHGSWLRRLQIRTHLTSCAECKLLCQEIEKDRVLLDNLKESVKQHAQLQKLSGTPAVINALTNFLGDSRKHVISSDLGN